MHRAIVAALLALLILAPSPAAAGENGLKVFVTSATNLDTAGFDPNAVTASVTLPLFQGVVAPTDSTTWYVITESSDKDDAKRLGVNWSPKLAHALGTAAVQTVTVRSDGLVRFASTGTVDFSPEHIVMAGPSGFPPDAAQPGSVGGATYSPLITTGNGIVLNAPQVANGTGLHDRILPGGLDTVAKRVTLHMTNGFYHDKPILYISFDASFDVAAALESATFAPNMNAAPGLGSNDRDTSARSSIIPIVNGASGTANPERQGLASALLNGRDPLNITIVHPGGDRYSPLWDVHAAAWTVPVSQRVRLTHHGEVADAFEKGLVTSAITGPANPDLGGLNAAGFIVNCPIIAMRS